MWTRPEISNESKRLNMIAGIVLSCERKVIAMKYEKAKSEFRHALDHQQTISIKKLRKLMQVMNMSLQPSKDVEVAYLRDEIKKLKKKSKKKKKKKRSLKNMNELIKKVEEWSKNKGLDATESSKQFLKVSEEVGEVAAALARDDKDELRDGIGDVVVTLIILAQQNDMDLYECLNQAYTEIKDRKGKMVNGVFVKSSDL